jgi:pimeloyl-ACP methyl ester carboxylesterase
VRRARVADTDLQFEFRGAGQPVLLIHGTVLADSFWPLAQEPAIVNNHLVIRYHRRGFGGSSRISMPWSIEQHAMDAARLLQQLGVRRAHIVGHSTGAAVAVQLALDFPEMVGSLTLLELALSSAAAAASVSKQFSHSAAIYDSGNKAGALDLLLQVFGGPDYRSLVDAFLPPGVFDVAVHDADTIFLYELPALAVWTLTQNIIMRLSGPVLLATGVKTLPIYSESQQLLAEWLPEAETVVFSEVGHALHMQAPDAIAEFLQGFFRRNPFSTSADAS